MKKTIICLSIFFIVISLFVSFTNTTNAVDETQKFTPQTDKKSSTVYNLLAPIGKLLCIDTNTLNPEKGCASGGIGDYLNTIFKIAIGLCGALAVVMIIISSIQYMGDESVFGKTEAKSKIFASILGLLIALGSYALLNTINPDLLGLKGVAIKQVIAEIEQPMEFNDPLPSPGAAVAQCPEGIVTVVAGGTSFPVCASIKDKLQSMIETAKKSNINISGFGFRSKTSQEKMRLKNCDDKTNAYNVSAKCKPETAMPGTSMHESGKAFDFRCDGLAIGSADNKCYVWLKANAGVYGFKNALPKEFWHWSTTGH